MSICIGFLFLLVIGGGSGCPSRCHCDENAARCWLPIRAVPNRDIIHIFGLWNDQDQEIDLEAYSLTWIMHDDMCPPSVANCV